MVHRAAPKCVFFGLAMSMRLPDYCHECWESPLRRDGCRSMDLGQKASVLSPATRALGDLIPCETAYTFDDRELWNA